jgi:hypothetical protein
VRDILVVAAVVVAFALLVTVHVAIVFGLAKRHPRWRSAVAFILAPLAPYWAWREHMRVRALLWAGAAALYIGARCVAAV